jgi:hypothetical protein
MSDPASEGEAVYHLLLDPDEVPVAASALRVLISDEAHQPEIRSLARSVLARLPVEPSAQEDAAPQATEREPAGGEERILSEQEPGGEEGVLNVPLSAPEMKITHTAVRLLLTDLQRQQHDERQILWRIIDKLPDEHVIRAITLE